MAFTVERWCRDCCGSDPMGCFGGGTEILEDDEGKPLVFESAEKAEEEIEEWEDIDDGAPYEYRVRRAGS